MSLSWRFSDEDLRDAPDIDYDEDRRQDARMEEIDERNPPATCADCGHEWDPGRHRATRLEPGWDDRPECPHCGSADRTDD